MGVPQGSILGPLLFVMFINDLPDCITESRCVIYADDTTLYASSRNPTNIEFALNKDLNIVSRWFVRNKLKLNVDKSKFLVIHPRNMSERFSNMNVFLNRRNLKRESVVKILGVHIDEDLKWHRQVRYMLRGLRFQYRAFSRSIKYFDRDTRLMVYNASIASRLNYADCIWNQCSLKERNMLQSVQNMAVKKIVNAAPLASGKPIIRSLGMLTLDKKKDTSIYSPFLPTIK